MAAPLDSRNAADPTLNGGFLFGDGDDTNPGRQALTREDLMARLTAMIQSCEGCEKVAVIGVTRLDFPDKDGINWSRSIVLDPEGVTPEVYALAYAQVIATAQESWNLR